MTERIDMSDTLRMTGIVRDQYGEALADADDGDIWIRPQLDAEGRHAVAGRHTNWGYSGYFVLALHANAGRRKLLDARIIFPLGQNRYSSKGEQSSAEGEVRQRVLALSGEKAVKVKGGYALVEGGAAMERMSQRLAEEAESRKHLSRPLGLSHAAETALDPRAREKFREIMRRVTHRSLDE
jgi:hypothetical protein